MIIYQLYGWLQPKFCIAISFFHMDVHPILLHGIKEEIKSVYHQCSWTHSIGKDTKNMEETSLLRGFFHYFKLTCQFPFPNMSKNEGYLHYLNFHCFQASPACAEGITVGVCILPFSTMDCFFTSDVM